MKQVFKLDEQGLIDYSTLYLADDFESIPDDYHFLKLVPIPGEDGQVNYDSPNELKKFRHPKWDGEKWVERKFAVLEELKAEKLTELYNAYQAEINSQITSSLVGPDGLNIVFPYQDKDRDNYKSIGIKFSLDPNKTESIIGSDSHGKFYIQRADFVTLANEFEAHEVNLYLKFKEKETAVNAADETTLGDIVW